VKPFIDTELDKAIDLMRALRADGALIETLERAAEAGIRALRDGRKVMFCGNGGSAADAQHLAAELVGKLGYDRPGLAAVSLTTDTSILTAIGNDYGYEDVFHRQIEAIGREGDVLVGLSTSGRSRNVVKAFRTARQRRIVTIGMTGSSGGDMPALSDYCLRMPSDETQKIQEAHIVVGHVLCGLIERSLFPKDA